MKKQKKESIHFSKVEILLHRKRTDKGDFWWELRACDYYEQFAKPKIMYQAFQVKPCFNYRICNSLCISIFWFKR